MNLSKMKCVKNTIILISLLGSVFTSVQAFSAENTPVTPINNLFDAMRAHDSEKMLAQFNKTAVLERATETNEITRSDYKKFAKFVGKSSKHFDEKIFNITVKQSGNLANVWTPFAFYLDEKLTHCGVNSIQLVKKNDVWKIQYIIDNKFQGDCKKFIEQEKAKATK